MKNVKEKLQAIKLAMEDPSRQGSVVDHLRKSELDIGESIDVEETDTPETLARKLGWT